MIVSNPPSGILDPNRPYIPVDQVGQATWLRLKGKLTGRRVEGLNENFTSYVKLGDADSDRLIENLKKYGQYPILNQTDKSGGAYNEEEYQKWLVEEFLEKPFRQQVDEKIERAQSFISSSSTLRPGKKISVKVNKMTGIIPKRPIPDELVSKISQPPSAQEEESVASPSRKVVSSLGRLTLDLVQINDNLDRIKEVIAEDYAQTKEKNKNEIEDYRKRIANRQRKLPKKDLGDDKSSLKDIIKPFVGGFFSGVGGAIRSLAAFNLMEALLNGDYMQVFKSLMGIGITFIPQIGTMIAGAVLKSLLKGFGRGMMGGGRMPMGRPGRMMGGGPGIGKFGAMMALGTGALALGSAFTSSQDTGGEDQTRLEELTAEQKALTDKGLVSITQGDLKKFQDLNKKFEETLNILLKKSKPGGDMTDKSPESTAPGTAPMTGDIGQVTSAVEDPNVKAFLDTLANVESGGRYDVSVGGATFSDMSKHPEMYNPELGSDAAGRYQFISTTFKPIAQRLGLTDFSPRSQDLAAVQYLKDLGVLDEIMTGDKAKIEDVIRRLRGSKWTGLKRYGAGQGFEFFQRRKQQYSTQSSVAPAPSKRNADEVSAAPGSSRGVLVSLVPTSTGSDSPGSANNNGTVGNDSVDPTNRDDTVGMLYRTQMNIMDVG